MGHSLFDELKRRNVFKASIAYLALGWVVTQVTSTVAPAMNLPAWIVPVVVWIGVIGFPFVIAFSWIYEITPEGLTRESEVDRAASITHVTSRRMDYIIIGMLAIALGLFAFDRFVPRHVGSTESPEATAPAAVSASATASSAVPTATSVTVAAGEKSIAVLPFENLSDEKANAYFAAGIQDEILKRLARIGAPKVISRTSTMHYTSAPDNLPQIARQLGVANILEGSVQKAGEAVHINVQLIRTATDEHLWADSYDRKLDDIFAVEGEVAQTIAERLKATLTGAEAQQVNAAPTRNRAAYDAYLHGLDAERRTFGFDQLKEASRYFSQATQLDPDFASAWAHGSDADGLLYFQAFDGSDARLHAARLGAENAMRLAPDSAEAWRAKGSFLYHTLDYPAAAAAFAEAARREPNNPDIVRAQAYLERRLGNYPNAIAQLERSLDRDPQDQTTIASLGETLDFMQRHAEARGWFDRGLVLRPSDPSLLALKGNTYLVEGDLDAAGAIFDPMPLQIDDATVLNTQMTYLMYRRRFADVVRSLKPVISAPDFVADGWTAAYYVALGWSERLAGDNAGAQATFAEGKRKIAALRASWGDKGYLASNQALLEAGLGDADAVERDGRRSLELSDKDKYTLAGLLAGFAGAQALAGRKEQALATLEQAQQAHGVQYGDLRYSPYLDNLRDDPRFQALMNSNGIAGKDAATR